MGEGSGIGLDIVNNVIKQHNGEIKVNSVPGRTEFTVKIPLSQHLQSKEKKDEASIHYNS